MSESRGGQPRRFPLTPFRGGFIGALRLALSPHGELLAFASLPGDCDPSSVKDLRGKIAVVIGSVDDGEVQRTIESADRPAFSPDGKKIAYRAGMEGAIWISPVAGGSAQLAVDLGKEKGAADPFWSPDSRMIAVQPHNGDKELWIVSVDEAGRATAPPMTLDLPYEGGPAGWTRDGRIGFLFRQKKTALYTVSASGGQPAQITPHGADFQGTPSWSLDSTDIFLNWNGRLSVIPAEGGQPVAIPISSTEPLQVVPVGGSNAVSPDGKLLVFSGTMEGVKGVNLWPVPVGGGEAIRLTSMPSPVEDRFPCWSPDGNRIVFLRQLVPGDWTTTKICIIPAQGGEAREITADTDQVALSSVAWSPDGRRLAYLNKSWKVMAVSLDDAEGPKAVDIKLQDAMLMEVAWSPDGSRFAFKAIVGESVTGENFELWLMEDFLPLIQGSQ